MTAAPWEDRSRRAARRGARARHEADSVLHYYRLLIALRHTEPVMAFGSFTMLLPQDEQVYAFLRRLEEVELLVLGEILEYAGRRSRAGS